MNSITLDEALKRVGQPDRKAMELAKKRWDSVAKPLGSLGALEDAIIRIAGILKNPRVQLNKKAIVICCGDNGIVEEGVTQTGQEVTGIVTENFTRGDSCVCLMAEQAGARIVPIDLGVAADLAGTVKEFPDLRKNFSVNLHAPGSGCTAAHESLAGAWGIPECMPPNRRRTSTVKNPIWDRKICRGTQNFLKGPAMTRAQAIKAVETGIEAAGHLKEQGYSLIGVGEMGIGNTTTSSAVVSVLLGLAPEAVTGRGAGLTDAGLAKKIRVIQEGIRKNNPNPLDGIDVLSKVGGFDLAGIAGVIIGGAVYGIPVVLDGFITGAAALAAAVICPEVKKFMIASHVSAEPAGAMVLEKLGLKPIIYGGMCLGEGTGAAAFFALLSMAQAVYENMSSFQEIHIEEYKHLS